MSATHKDVEFHVSGPGIPDEILKNPKTALMRAAEIAIARGSSQLDVVIWSRHGAKWFEGEDGASRYDEDPDASVYDRIQFRANDMGRVP